MEKEFVNYNQALKLKELGFDEPCLKTMLDFDITYESDVKMPLYQQAFRWFREKHAIYAIILPSYADNKVVKDRFFYEIANGKNLKQELNYHSTYEEAELACLEKLIQIVESKSE